MICKMRVKPFDVLIINRIANMTSVDCATHLADVCQVKGRKGWPPTDCGTIIRRKVAILKNSSKNIQSKLILFVLDCLNPQPALLCSFVAVNILVSSTIELLK